MKNVFIHQLIPVESHLCTTQSFKQGPCFCGLTSSWVETNGRQKASKHMPSQVASSSLQKRDGEQWGTVCWFRPTRGNSLSPRTPASTQPGHSPPQILGKQDPLALGLGSFPKSRRRCHFKAMTCRTWWEGAWLRSEQVWCLQRFKTVIKPTKGPGTFHDMQVPTTLVTPLQNAAAPWLVWVLSN